MTNEVFGRIDNLITTQKKKKNDLNDYLYFSVEVSKQTFFF